MCHTHFAHRQAKRLWQSGPEGPNHDAFIPPCSQLLEHAMLWTHSCTAPLSNPLRPLLSTRLEPPPAPTSTPPKAASTSTGPSVAERLAKMRAGPGGADPAPGGSPTGANKPGLVRTFTPPINAPTVVTQSPGGGRGVLRACF